MTQPVTPTALAALNSPSKGLPVALEQMQHTPLPAEQQHQLTHSLQQPRASLSDTATAALFGAHELGRYLSSRREQQQLNRPHRQQQCQWDFLLPTRGGLVSPRSSQVSPGWCGQRLLAASSSTNKKRASHAQHRVASGCSHECTLCLKQDGQAAGLQAAAPAHCLGRQMGRSMRVDRCDAFWSSGYWHCWCTS